MVSLRYVRGCMAVRASFVVRWFVGEALVCSFCLFVLIFVVVSLVRASVVPGLLGPWPRIVSPVFTLLLCCARVIR